jgi:hypothetical protein
VLRVFLCLAMAEVKELTNEMSQQICEAVASGSNLDRICGTDGIPNKRVVYGWLKDIPEFAADYARARMTRADARSDRIDDYVRQMINGGLSPEQTRVAIDAEKWQAGKENSKYGDKMQLGGASDLPPMSHNLSVRFVGSANEDESGD